jgi:hypothetical protein
LACILPGHFNTGINPDSMEEAKLVEISNINLMKELKNYPIISEEYARDFKNNRMEMIIVIRVIAGEVGDT